jgi:hypothetical protein
VAAIAPQATVLKKPGPFVAPRSDLDDFLFATVGEGDNGTPLSVLSALSQLDVDPWDEAEKLARLPGKIAIQRLASLIAALPDDALPSLDTEALAARLVALLPRRANSGIPSRKSVAGVGAAGTSRALLYGAIVAFVIGAVWIMASLRSPERVGDAHAPASGIAVSGTPRSGAD